MSEVICVQDLEDHAIKILPKNVLGYFIGESGSGFSVRNNRKQFLRYLLRPRVLRDVSERDVTTSVLGEKISIPIGIAPTGMQKLAHLDGECATARAAQAMGAVFILSTVSTCSIEEVAEAAPLGTNWFQLYALKDPEATKSLVKRAELAGFKAIVLTVDLPILGKRLSTLRDNFYLPKDTILTNFKGHPAAYLYSREEDSRIGGATQRVFHSGLDWSYVKWLQSVTSLPIIIKGILTAEDARICADMGVSAIMVSNHGGRQLDTTISPLEALPEIVRAAGDKLEIYFDGGIREGIDVFKALALGAKMVFVGRPAIWGLVYAGEKGVQQMLEILKQEFHKTLALTGCTSVDKIVRDMVVHKDTVSRL